MRVFTSAIQEQSKVK